MASGLLEVIIGLMLFLEGLKPGLMPLGEAIGNTLPRKSVLPAVLGRAFITGVGVTFAEAAIGALQTAGRLVSVETAPCLYTILNDRAGALVLVVGCGVGLAVVLGTLRFIFGWSLKPLVYLTLVPAPGLSLYVSAHPELQKILGLAWDCGAVRAGPVTVPLVLSLGIGIATSAGKGNAGISGFGIVTLASLFPIIGVLGLGIYIVSTVPVESIMLAATHGSPATAVPAWYGTTPGREIAHCLRAILPLVVFLYLVANKPDHCAIQRQQRPPGGDCVERRQLYPAGLSYRKRTTGRPAFSHFVMPPRTMCTSANPASVSNCAAFAERLSVRQTMATGCSR
jgi:hypothetical protein